MKVSDILWDKSGFVQKSLVCNKSVTVVSFLNHPTDGAIVSLQLLTIYGILCNFKNIKQLFILYNVAKVCNDHFIEVCKQQFQALIKTYDGPIM